jgi:hypothetical protein
MKNWIPKSTTAAIAMALLTGCWASKEETSNQLQQHMRAYEELKISPGNAQSTIKSIDLLLTPSDNNNFAKLISSTQGEMLRSAKWKAEGVLKCMKIAESAKEKLLSKAWDIKNTDNNTSLYWKPRLEEVKSANQCDKSVQGLMSEDEGKILSTLAKETSAKYEDVLSREKAEQKAKAAQEKAKLAEEERQRCRRFGNLSTQSNQAAHSLEAQGCMTKNQALEFYVKNPSICTSYSEQYPIVCKKVFEDMPGNIPGLHNPYR